jgi:glycogen debranching enzyme
VAHPKATPPPTQLRTFPARPRPIIRATDLGSAQVLKHRDLFLLSDAFGDIHPDSRGLGLYDGDTRVLSCSVLRVAGERPVVLHSDPGGSWRGTVIATNAELRKDPGDKMGSDGSIARRTISIGRERTLSDVYRERLEIQNHGPFAFDLEVELELDMDAADIFEVRGYARPKRGTLLPIEVDPDGILVFAYVGLDDVTVKTRIGFDPAPTLAPSPDYDGGAVVATWDGLLAPGESRIVTWEVSTTRDPSHGLLPPAADLADDPVSMDPGAIHSAWDVETVDIETDHEVVNQVLRRSMDDLCLLRSTTQDGDEFIAAGVPWFATLFGRDALVTSLQSVPFAPRLAVETLAILAKHQAQDLDPWRDAEPGKILHEFRTGEMTRTGELPFSPYYGSVDATPLWLVLLGETHDWTGDDALVERLWPNVLAALAWIDDWGDRDGDGFVEYERRAPSGLLNQGWKDSGDAIRWADGTLATTPIALAEVQGYVFDAKKRIARLARGRGELDLADRLESQAAALKRRFAEAFTLPDGYIAMALDGDKRPVDTIGSNAGHCLWSGIVEKGAAAAVVERLGSPAMSSGWGLRTYGADQPGYNPIGYHIGTVWPHDTAIAAAGARRYGFDLVGSRLSGELLAASHHFPAYRLPELFCGFDRASTGAPVAYPVACSPQAWAAGSPLMLIRTMLGLHADASLGQLTLEKPDLPKDITKIVITGLRVGTASCDLLLHRWRGLTSAEVLRKDGPLEVIVRL